MSHRFRLALVFAAIASVWPLTGVAQAPGYLLFTDPGNRFSVEFPKDWRWMIVAGSGEALVTFVEPKSAAAVVVERFRMKQPLAMDDITDVFVQIETDVLKENQPKASDVGGKVLMQGRRRAVVVDYSRPGLNEAERVRQYSYPVADSLYRITCMALNSQFKRYEATFATVAESLKSANEIKKPPSPKP